MFLINKLKNVVIVVLVIALLFSSGWIYHLKTNPIIETVTETVTEYVEKIVPVEVIKTVYIEKEVTGGYGGNDPQNQPVMEVSESERELVARATYLEGGGESFECMTHIASVIFARRMDGYWGDTIEEVLYSPGQFSVAPVINSTTPSEEAYRAVDYVIENGLTLPPYVLYFCAGGYFNWDGFTGYYNIDNVYFGYLQADKAAYELKEG